MNRERIREVLFESLRRVAPEAEPERLRADADLREELDIDSMDFLRYVTAVHQALGVEIPESDYPRLFTLGSGEEHLASLLGVQD
jgi:acyl carrier protein